MLWKVLPWAGLLVVLLAFGGVLMFYPQKIVQSQGKLYRWVYRKFLKISDEEMNSFPMLPTDRSVMVSRSYFVDEAPEHPERFQGLIQLYRLIGLGLGLMSIAVLCLLVLALIAGVLKVT